jgi:hypothetical protein
MMEAAKRIPAAKVEWNPVFYVTELGVSFHETPEDMVKVA